MSSWISRKSIPGRRCSWNRGKGRVGGDGKGGVGEGSAEIMDFFKGGPGKDFSFDST